jgi:tRNA 2-thiouridine synthesizing protein A
MKNITRRKFMIELDLRGLSCPIPVVKTKQAIDKNPGEPISILLETAVAKENVSRLAESKKYSVKIEPMAQEECKLILTPAA